MWKLYNIMRYIVGIIDQPEEQLIIVQCRQVYSWYYNLSRSTLSAQLSLTQYQEVYCWHYNLTSLARFFVVLHPSKI